MLKKFFLGEPLNIGAKAPEFKALDQEDREHSLSQYQGQWVVLYFYPLDFTPGCTAEACSFRDEYLKIQTRGAVILGVSTDSVKQHKKFSDKHLLPFKILSDRSKTVSKAYGVLTLLGLANRVTYLIDPQGRIADVLSNIPHAQYGAIVEQRLSKLK